tara:strand:- start:1315 stop:2025 length:711 start_codon:yes stop_codon:yes gene_type:complete
MEITLTNSNSLKIISGNCTLITNPSLDEEYNIGLFNDPLSNIQNNNLNVKTPGEFEIDNFYITSVGYKTSSKNNENETSNIDSTENSPLQPSLMNFDSETNSDNNEKTTVQTIESNDQYAIYHIIQVEGIKILALGTQIIPSNQKSKLSSENPKVIFTPHNNISTVDNNTFSKLISDIDYRVLVISDLQESYEEEKLYDNSRISFGIKDKSNLNKLNITQNNMPKEKRIVLLNQTK